MRIKIQVKQKHINNANRGKSNSCPIALALKDVFVGQVSVSQYFVFLNEYSAQPTQRMVKFIDKFDEFGKKAVKPTTFTLTY
jgi:hypothetical protein